MTAHLASTPRAYHPLAGGARQANSDQRDVNARVKASALAGGAELVLGYSIQTAEKGTPAYDGLDAAVQRRYWRWPHWGDRTIFGVASVPISDSLRLRARAYHRAFDNELNAHDDATFTTRKRPSSFTSFYDDQTAGGSVEVDVDGLGRHALRGAASLSASAHREWNLGEPVRVAKGRTWSIGLEDRVMLGARAVALLGVAADGLDVRRADDLRAGAIVAMPSSREASVNPQGALLISPSPSTLVRVTLAQRTRLPTVKERYSYRQGRAIPNPALREERARHAEVSATWSAGARIELHVAAFDSAVSDVAERVFLQPNLYQLQNVGGARHRGVETSLRWRPSATLQAHAAYTLLDRTLSDADLKAIDTPRHRTLGSIAWTPIAPVTLSADVEHEQGRWSQDDAGRYAQAPDGATIALAARVRLPRRAMLGVVLRNAGDREYTLVEGFPEPGRTIDVELRFRF
jgi:iron complex outermembrane receptor protein